MGHYPCVRDGSETRAASSLHDPCCAIRATASNEAGFNGVCCRTSGPKPVGVWVRRCLGDWIKRKPGTRLAWRDRAWWESRGAVERRCSWGCKSAVTVEDGILVDEVGQRLSSSAPASSRFP